MTTIRLNDSTAKELKELCFRTDSYEKVIAMLIGSFIRSKLYARCDMCYLCFNISELSIVEHEQTSKISDTPDEFLLKRFTQAETVRLICNRCLRDAAEKEV